MYIESICSQKGKVHIQGMNCQFYQLRRANFFILIINSQHFEDSIPKIVEAHLHNCIFVLGVCHEAPLSCVKYSPHLCSENVFGVFRVLSFVRISAVLLHMLILSESVPFLQLEVSKLFLFRYFIVFRLA